MKALVFYKSGENGYGFRPHSFDWKVGDRIMSADGKSYQRILKITPATPEILAFANKLMAKCKRYAGEGQSRISWKNLTVTTTTWKDGTGYTHFVESIRPLPDYLF